MVEVCSVLQQKLFSLNLIEKELKMNYGIEKYKTERKIDIKVESTRGNTSVKTFSVYSDHGDGSMMLRNKRGILFSMKHGHTIRSTAFKSKKIYDVCEIIVKSEKFADDEIESVRQLAEFDMIEREAMENKNT